MNTITTKCSKKVLYNIIAAICICIPLSGCGEKPEEVALPESEIIYDDAEITLPAGLVGEEVANIEASDIDEDAETITYSLSGNERNDILNGLAADINSSISVILEDKDHYPNITAITPNDDYTEFTIALDGGTFNTYESMLSMSFYIVGNKYQIYNGVSDEDALTVVRYVDSATGDVISETDSSLMN
ncbi:MAG: hypothetical protein NC313_05720 [Butyrivibrio sp.]|nr:hypothetical protein [Butyrivibrio sp.]